jgi:RNA polymerase sigma-70 factor (ECF subfamily)
VSETSLADLARRIAIGDREAEEELVRRFAHRIRLYGLKHLGDEAAAADLTQDVLVTVLSAARGGRIEQPDRLDSFVLGTCRNTARGFWRSDRRRRAMEERLPLDATVDPERPPLDADRLWRCADRLPPRERRLLELTYIEERPAADIGEALGLAPGHVRVLRHRALAKLHACLEQGEAS